MIDGGALIVATVAGIASVVCASILSWIGWNRKAEKRRIANIEKEIHNVGTTLLQIDNRVGHLETQYVDEPRVQKIVDESIDEVKEDIKELKVDINTGFKGFSEQLTEISLQLAQDAGYKKAMMDIKSKEG